MLVKLLTDGWTIHLSASTDADPQIDDRWICLTLVNAKLERKTATASNLDRTLLTITGNVRKKECTKCHEAKPLDEFSKRTDRPDGRNLACLACERKRVKAYETRKRAEAKALVEKGISPSEAVTVAA